MMLRVEAHWPLRAGQCCKVFFIRRLDRLFNIRRHFGTGRIVQTTAVVFNAIVGGANLVPLLADMISR